jgi:hypothetical protein
MTHLLSQTDSLEPACLGVTRPSRDLRGHSAGAHSRRKNPYAVSNWPPPFVEKLEGGRSGRPWQKEEI